MQTTIFPKSNTTRDASLGFHLLPGWLSAMPRVEKYQHLLEFSESTKKDFKIKIL